MTVTTGPVADSPAEGREEYAVTIDHVSKRYVQDGPIVLEDLCLEHVSNPQRGKNMFVLGLLSCIYQRDLKIAEETVTFTWFSDDAFVSPSYKSAVAFFIMVALLLFRPQGLFKGRLL